MRKITATDLANPGFRDVDFSQANWVRCTVTLDAETLKRFERLALRAGMSRSRFMGIHLMMTELVADAAMGSAVGSETP